MKQMICKNCGAELKENAKFCQKCGTPVSAESAVDETTVNEENVATDNSLSGTGTETNKKKWILGAVGAVCGIALIGGIVFAATRGGKDDGIQSDAQQVAVADTEIDNEAETPLYTITDIGTVDLSVQNHTPGIKQAGIDWDKTMFYWLEDVDQTSTEDGNISKCLLTKTQLRNAATGNIIQYEIYQDAQDGTIYKIVSMEIQAEGGYQLKDYYYWLGKPNFIFQRTDSVYTPTYATPDKVGERFYFNDDVMARWRKIYTPGEISEYTLTMTDPGYTQIDYFTDTEESRAQYDAAELMMLNDAYNTLEAVTSQPVIGTVAGSVRDSLGNPLEGLVVNIYRAEDDVLLYQGTTGADGGFWILTYLDGTDCYIRIAGDDTYRDITVQGVRLANTSLIYSYENLVRHKVDGDEYPVQLALYSVMDVNTAAGSTGSVIAGATVTFREGASAYSGDAAATAQADENGIVSVNLLSGTYTAEIQAAGYASSYLTVEVADAAVAKNGYLMPAPAEGQTGIIMTWDGVETDLDLTVFTPYQSTGGDMAHIGGSMLNDGNGNYIIADNTAGCEAAYINTASSGTFKVYVNDYTDSQAGNYTANTFVTVNVHIYIYNSNGFVAEYVIPAGQSGVVWEVAEISGSQVTPSQRVYTVLEGKNWWLTKGGVSAENLEARQAYYDVLFNGSEYLYFNPLYISYDEDYSEYGSFLSLDYMDYYVLRDINGDGIEELYIQDSTHYSASADIYGVYSNNNYFCNTWLLTYHDGKVYASGGADGFILLQNNTFVSCVVGDITARTCIAYFIDEKNTSVTGEASIYTANFDGQDSYSIQSSPVSMDEYMAWLEQLAENINNNQIPASEWTELNEQNFRTKELGGNTQTTNLSAVREAYYEYIRTSTYLDCEGARLIFVDNNRIPEIYFQGLDTATGERLLWYVDGTVQERFFTLGGGEYIPKTGLILSHEGQIEYYDILLRLEGGILQEIASGEYERPESVNNFSEHYNWNGQEAVTYEEYEQILSQDYDLTRSVDAFSLNDKDGYTMSELLNLLQDDAAFADAVRAAW